MTKFKPFFFPPDAISQYHIEDDNHLPDAGDYDNFLCFPYSKKSLIAAFHRRHDNQRAACLLVMGRIKSGDL
ncbi:hypothetical protein HJ110_21965 [Vibrio parahaemolyticus]|nr:hypothetical protein [Vibrio parahaemolyticus]